MTFFRATHDGGGGSGGIAEPVAAEEELADAGPVATSDLDEEPVTTEEELADSGPVATRELDEEPVTTREPKLGFEEPVEATAVRASCSLESRANHNIKPCTVTPRPPCPNTATETSGQS